MKFRSTRGVESGLSFEDSIFKGHASDGGLLMPEVIPKIDLETLGKWKDLCYADLCTEIWSLFIGEAEISTKQLRDIVNKAYGRQFTCPVTQITDNLYILELFHGKTKAFKDISLQLVSQFLDFFLERQKKHLVLLVGTSGDTGSAAIESVRGSPWIDIIVLFPKGYCNKVQELQMTTVQDDNVHVFAMEGTSDNLDVPIKACFLDSELVAKYNIGSVNSINIARIITQLVFYFYSYLRVSKRIGDQVNIVVPTGAVGNVTAGCVANRMGLPIRLHCAVNENNIVHRGLSSGQFSTSPTVFQTWSSSMDIQVPYNMERILYLFSDMDTSLVQSLMKEFEENKAMLIPEKLRQKISETLTSNWVSQDSTLATMRKVWQHYQYLVCPHTAVGMTVAMDSSKENMQEIPTVCIATASPAKFAEAVAAAGIEFTPPPEIAILEMMQTKCKEMKKGEDWEDILKKTITSIGEKYCAGN